VGEFKYEKFENIPENEIVQRRQELFNKAIALGEAQIKKRRYAKGLFTEGVIVKCIAVAIVGKTDVAVKIFDPHLD
jgi:hypothetical protein